MEVVQRHLRFSGPSIERLKRFQLARVQASTVKASYQRLTFSPGGPSLDAAKVKASVPEPYLNRTPTKAQSRQLGSIHDAVLLGRQHRHPLLAT